MLIGYRLIVSVAYELQVDAELQRSYIVVSSA